MLRPHVEIPNANKNKVQIETSIYSAHVYLQRHNLT